MPSHAADRQALLFAGRALAMLLLLGSAGSGAGEAWVTLGELHFPKQNVVGQLSVNLDTLRRRNSHFEIWERISFAAASPGRAVAAEDAAERMTLWAIRCRRGAMAKVTERVAGSFPPRSESLRFYFPSPDSSGAAVIETTCAEARRRSAEGRAMAEVESAQDARLVLDRPPSILEQDLDDDDE